jgi:hypothetical protein
MSKPVLDSADINAFPVPSRCAGFTEAVELDAFANGMSLARNFNLLFLVTIAYGSLNCAHGLAVSTIDPGFQGNSFQLIQEMRFGVPITVNEYPTVARWILVPFFQCLHQFIGYRSDTNLV